VDLWRIGVEVQILNLNVNELGDAAAGQERNRSPAFGVNAA
jgi:hypothetical protein